MKKTKPKSEYGYYCDLCGEIICKYLQDFRACGGMATMRSIHKGHGVIDHVEFDVCHDCAVEIAQGVIDGY